MAVLGIPAGIVLCPLSDFFLAEPYFCGAQADMLLGPVVCLPAIGLGATFPRQREEAAGILKAGFWGTVPLWPLALRSGEWWTVAQHLCAGALGWRQWWEMECPAHLGGSCGPAFLARLAEPSLPRTGGRRAHILPGSWELPSWWRSGAGGGDLLLWGSAGLVCGPAAGVGIGSAPGLQQSSPAADLAKLFTSGSLALLICEMRMIVIDLAHGVLGDLRR